ncbi:Elongation factor G-like protein TM_1651 [hydrothermal vent metagenome]|uniref:Elongation factor G-like protein TM_1651 n=1 Tax=hydrothermal vent metagenome TaxID=652676 RepID=A0A3B1BTU3_9ZZZZ
MTTFEPEKIRNVGIISHSGAGKTSLAESMLYDSKTVNRRGTVEEGNTVMDFDPEEIKRTMSISTSIASCEWKGHKINILDTPGDQNFVPDTLLCMDVMDAALVIISAVSGIKVQTEKVWSWACDRKLARVIFINKMDNDRASYETTFGQINAVFKQKTLKFTLPIGSGPGFTGVVDLLHMKAYIYEKDGEGSFKEEEIPDNLLKWAEKERREVVESVAETDEELLGKYLENNTLEKDDLFKGLRKAVIAGDVVPVLCGSATQNIVIRKTLDTIINFFPSPLDVSARTGVDDKGVEVKVAPDPEGPAVAQVFKTIADPYAGKLSLFRVYSGSVSSDSNLYNISKGQKEHVGSLVSLQGKKQTQIEKATLGDIVAVAKLKSVMTGDTLADQKTKVVLNKTVVPVPVISYAVEAKSKADDEKITTSLRRLEEEDPTLRVEMDKQTNELIVSGMGQVHIEVTMHKLKEKFGLDVTIKPPRIAYKETIRGKAKGHGRLKKQSGGRGQFADCKIELEPTDNGAEFEFVNAIVGGAIPRQFIPGVEKGVKEVMSAGVLAGYNVTNCKVTLYDGQFHDVDSSELAFKIAASMAFKEAFMQCSPVLLEPVMEMEIVAPGECVGDVVSDLNKRRGRVLGVGAMGGQQRVKARVPMSEILSYAPDLRSITGGRGQFTMHFAAYEDVPPHLTQKIIDESKNSDSE